MSIDTLRLRRPDGTEREVAVQRRNVETRTVKGVARTADGWRWTLDPDRRIAYVRITQFTDRTAAELDTALAKVRADGVSGLVLDLVEVPEPASMALFSLGLLGLGAVRRRNGGAALAA